MAATDSSDVGIIQSSQDDMSSKVELTIHHQFPGIELVSPLYASDDATCYLLPDQKVDVGSMTQAGFNIDSGRLNSRGILMYRLKRKNIDQSNEDIMSNEDEVTCIQLIVIWEVYRSGEIHASAFLIEHDKSRIWDRDRLMKLAWRYELFDIQYSPLGETCLMSDNTVLMMSVTLALEKECYKLRVTLYETTANDSTRKPWYIDIDK
jgi:hypothetical protein